MTIFLLKTSPISILFGFAFLLFTPARYRPVLVERIAPDRNFGKRRYDRGTGNRLTANESFRPGTDQKVGLELTPPYTSFPLTRGNKRANKNIRPEIGIATSYS